MWKNKHIVVALLVAPVLALIAWFAVDGLVAEQPHAAVAGASYKLVEKPGCRYAGGDCVLVNGDFRLQLTASKTGRLTINGSHALSSVMIAADTGSVSLEKPLSMTKVNDQGQVWQLDLDDVHPELQLRVLASAGRASYFAETTLAFME